MKVLATLKHFAVVTYDVSPDEAERLLPDRFALDIVRKDGMEKALLSIVTFRGEDFRWAALPCVRFTFYQTNYRLYVTLRQNNEKAVWFLGTVMDSKIRHIPRLFWKLPWHKGTFSLEYRYDPGRNSYSHYKMTTRSDWAAMELSLTQHGHEMKELPGFNSAEEGMQFLTQRFAGYYPRIDGRIGKVKVWHQRLDIKHAACLHARFSLLDRLGLVPIAQHSSPHSVLLNDHNNFMLHLPPAILHG